jgi:hypothetical protein
MERMDVIRMAETFGENRNHAGRRSLKRLWSSERIFGRERDEQGGFVHVLWLLVVLSAFLFGATLVNIGVGMKIYETSSRQTAAIEKLTLSIREVQKSVLYLSKVIEESDHSDEEDSDRPMQEGRI